MKTLVIALSIALAQLALGCGEAPEDTYAATTMPGGTSSGATSSDGKTSTKPSTAGTSSKCSYKEPGTNFAPCSKDSDCFGSYCDLTGKPAPYCHVPGATQVAQLHGITCKMDAECTRVLTSTAIKRGVVGKCQGRNSLDKPVCQFTCMYP